MTKKKTAGRPPKKAAERQSELITCKVTKAERAALTKKAKLAGMKRSTWIRWKLLSE
jgi:hypothetical protein